MDDSQWPKLSCEYLGVFRGIVLTRLDRSTVFSNVISAVSFWHLRLHTPDLHWSNLSQPIRTVYTVTSFGPVIATAALWWFIRTLSIPASAAISVRSKDGSSRSESFRRTCKSSAAFPFTPSSECVNSTVSLCRRVSTFNTHWSGSAARSGCPCSTDMDSFDVLSTSVEPGTGFATSVGDVASLSFTVVICTRKTPANLFTDDLPSTVTRQFAETLEDCSNGLGCRLES